MGTAALAKALVFATSITLVVAACGSGDDELDTATVAGATARDLYAECRSSAPATATVGGQSTVTPKSWASPPAMQLEDGKDYVACIHTNKGDILIDLDEQGAPKTVNNFVFLAGEGYFSNVPFHRVVKGFVIQTGDPTGTGRGGPGYRFADEAVTKSYTRGTIAMANSGPNTNGSQFFICLADLPTLPKNYTIFGTVTDGMDVVDAIASVPTTLDASGREQSSPTEAVTMLSVEIMTR